MRNHVRKILKEMYEMESEGFYVTFFQTIYPFIKDKPFYCFKSNGELIGVQESVVNNDGVSDLYFVGDVINSNNVSVYWFEPPHNKVELTNDYKQVIIGQHFYHNDWNLREWYQMGINAKKFVEGLPSVSDIFDQLNESEEDEFDWVKGLVDNIPFKYVEQYLGTEDEITVSGDILADDGEFLYSLMNDRFIVKTDGKLSGDSGYYLKWVESPEKRRDGWKRITIENAGSPRHDCIEINSEKFPEDGNLLISNIKKADYPF